MMAANAPEKFHPPMQFAFPKHVFGSAKIYIYIFFLKVMVDPLQESLEACNYAMKMCKKLLSSSGFAPDPNGGACTYTPLL